MIRFFAVGNLRGAFKRPRLLGDANQTEAIKSYERELIGIGEIVIWRGDEARVAPAGYRPQHSELRPRVSRLLREQVIGAPLENCEKSAQQRERMGKAKKI